jgi:ribosome-binding protein aMBF1 (putative translation factor)
MTVWTRAEMLVCPDCGHKFGERTTAGSINPTPSSREPEECRHKGGAGPGERRCPRVSEIIEAADRSERTL